MKLLFVLVVISSIILTAEKGPKLHVMTRYGHFDMDPEYALSLLCCSKLPLVDDGKVLDVSQTRYQRVDLDRLASVIQFSQPITCLDGQETISFLNMAVDLGAPLNALMTIGKELYTRVNRQMSPAFREQQIESELLTKMSTAAQHHLPGPKTFLEHLKRAEKLKVHTFVSNVGFHHCVFDLSHSHCIINAGYTQRFATLAGLRELLQFIKDKSHVFDCDRWSLDLSGHHLDKCSLKEIKDALPLRTFVELDLSKNWFYCLSAREFDTPDLPEKLVLAKNRICRIDAPVFQVINTARSRAYGSFKFVLNLLDNDETLFTLTKREIQTNFNKAVFTIPERFGIYEHDGTVFTTYYKLALMVTSFSYVCYCLASSSQSDSLTHMQKSALTFTAFMYWYLLSKRFDARLARISHPELNCDNKDFHEKGRSIWPENSAKLLI